MATNPSIGPVHMSVDPANSANPAMPAYTSTNRNSLIRRARRIAGGTAGPSSQFGPLRWLIQPIQWSKDTLTYLLPRHTSHSGPSRSRPASFRSGRLGKALWAVRHPGKSLEGMLTRSRKKSDMKSRVEAWRSAEEFPRPAAPVQDDNQPYPDQPLFIEVKPPAVPSVMPPVTQETTNVPMPPLSGPSILPDDFRRFQQEAAKAEAVRLAEEESDWGFPSALTIAASTLALAATGGACWYLAQTPSEADTTRFTSLCATASEAWQSSGIASKASSAAGTVGDWMMDKGRAGYGLLGSAAATGCSFVSDYTPSCVRAVGGKVGSLWGAAAGGSGKVS